MVHATGNSQLEQFLGSIQEEVHDRLGSSVSNTCCCGTATVDANKSGAFVPSGLHLGGVSYRKYADCNQAHGVSVKMAVFVRCEADIAHSKHLLDFPYKE